MYREKAQVILVTNGFTFNLHLLVVVGLVVDYHMLDSICRVYDFVLGVYDLFLVADRVVCRQRQARVGEQQLTRRRGHQVLTVTQVRIQYLIAVTRISHHGAQRAFGAAMWQRPELE